MNYRNIPAAALALSALTACGASTTNPSSSSIASKSESSIYSEECITEQEVVAAQQAWGDGIVEIGRVYSDGGDYKRAASDHINNFYGYDLSLVLFKPTLASIDQFRASFDGALSYFVGDNPSYAEDKGFALKPWTKVRWWNAGIINNGCSMAIAQGNYFFTPVTGDEVKVEFSIAYVKDKRGDLRMVVHDSSLPYTKQ